MRYRGIVLGAVLLGCGVSLGWIGHSRQTRDGVDLFRQVSELVSDEFVDSLGMSEIYERASRGLIGQLDDPYAALFSPADQERFDLRYGGKYGGVGIAFEELDSAFVARRVMAGSPAEAAGIMPGDRIVAVEGQSIRGWPLTKITENLRGPAGTPVSADFIQATGTTPKTFRFTRAVIHLPSVPYSVTFSDSVGYIPLQQFTETSAGEVRTALSGLVRRGARALILDLRGNGGGYTDQATEIANLFLPKDQEVFVERGRLRENHVRTTVPALAPSLPLVVLADSLTASAAEIVAGALQDHDRALLIGDRSYGKGLVQTARTLPNGWRLVMTTGRWFTASGRSIQRSERDVGKHRASSTPGAASVDSAPPSVFRTDGGRPLAGGGGVTPDLVLGPDTLTTVEQPLARALAAAGRETYLVLREIADSLKPTVKSSFASSVGLRESFQRRMQLRKITIERSALDAGSSYLDQLIEYRVSQHVFGDSAAGRRALEHDSWVEQARELAHRSRSQAQLLLAAGETAAKRQHN